MRGQTFLDIVLREDILDIEEEISTGHRLATVRIDSNMLPITQPDTYHMFNGDSSLEMDIQYFQEAFDFDLTWDHYDTEYNHEGIRTGLSEAIIESMPTSDDGVLRSVSFWNTWSPREYNFTTDSFNAEWTVDLDALAAWLESREDARKGWETLCTVEEIMCEIFKSRSGFISHVPRYFRDEEEWATVWGALYLWLKEETEEDDWLSVAEAEHEIYSENVTYHWSADLLARVTGWDEDECDELEQEDIDELIWEHINWHHNRTVYGHAA